MPSYAKNRLKSHSEWEIGGKINIAAGAEMQIAGVSRPLSMSFAPAAAASTVCEVTITVLDGAGVAVAEVHTFDLWLSDAATGAGLTGTTASGTVTAKAASGIVVSTLTAKKNLRVQTLATGVFVLEITDTAKTGFYVAASCPGTDKTIVSAQLVTADYGA